VGNADRLKAEKIISVTCKDILTTTSIPLNTYFFIQLNFQKMKNNNPINKKVLLSGSLVAGAILGLASLQVNAKPVSYTNLGSGAAVRGALTGASGAAANAIELSCGAKKDSAMAGKSKEGKCGQGKCGEGKCGDKKGHKSGGKKGTAKPKADTSKSGR
jgi:uncharacterized low-complexity protein